MVRTVAVHPLGVHGEGLFQYLKQTKTRNLFPIINEGLKILDWFEDVSPADDLLSHGTGECFIERYCLLFQ